MILAHFIKAASRITQEGNDILERRIFFACDEGRVIEWIEEKKENVTIIALN